MIVLEFIPSLNRYDGGTTTYMQQLAPALGKLVELHVCALGNIADFVPLEGCKVHSITLSMRHLLRMKREWLSLLDEVKPDVVHLNCCWMPQIACVARWTRSWRPNCRIAITPHGMLEPWIIRRNYLTKKLPAIWLYQRATIQQADVVIATAQSELEHVLQLGWTDKVAIAPNGIDVESIQMKREWRRPKRLLFMSRLHPKKGLEMLFDALKSCTADWEVQLAGDGERQYVEHLKAIAPPCVRFLGPVYGADKWQLIQESDLVVLPSFSENYGLIVAEALASGTPVITTTGTPWGAIEKYDCGWWVAPETASICAALEQASKMSESEMEQMGRQARRLAEQECGSAKMAEELAGIFNKICVDL